MNESYTSAATLRLLLPETMIVGLATWTYVWGTVGGGRSGTRALVVGGLAAVGYVLYLQDTQLGFFSEVLPTWESGPIIVDFFGHIMRWVALGAGLLLVLTASRAGPEHLATEYLGSLLMVIAGLMLVCTAGDLILLFLGLELISIPTYVLLYLGRNDAGSQEATTKYFFLSILSASLLLYGFTFLYGVAGATNLSAIQHRLTEETLAPPGLVSLLPLGMLLILAGLGFKMAAVPFHFYAPDVYQGTTSGNAGLLAVVPKAAGLVALVRLLIAIPPQLDLAGWKVLLAISALSMTLGNVLALWQQNPRRLMAYSSIAHGGYMLIGIAVALAASGHTPAAQSDGIAAALVYLVVYSLATVGMFAALTYLGRKDGDMDSVDELAGLGSTHRPLALAISVFMFSLTGIPPLAGFWGKLVLFTGALAVDADVAGNALRNWFVGLAAVGALNAAISAGYYLRIVGLMYFRAPLSTPRAEGGSGAWLVAVASAILLVIVGLFPRGLVDEAGHASRSARAAISRGR